MSWFCNPIFQTEVSPTHRIALSIYPIPGYLPVWNAVCFIYSIPTSPLVYYTHLLMAFSLQHGLWLTWNVSASISVSTSWMISLWSGAIWSHSSGISGEIVKLSGSRSSSQVQLAMSEMFWNSRLLTARGHINENILLDRFLYLSVLSSTKNASWMISLWSEAFWSYSSRISGEIVNAAGLDQVSKFAGSQQVKCFEICHFSQPVGTFTRTFSLTSFCSWFA